jgi:NAD(P)-dependent dehydrogenase (short-subunit alcohol dehydrogenase family)
MWDEVMNANLRSVFLTVKAAWEYLAASEGSVIINASTLGLMAIGGQVPYCVSKAGLVMLARCLALEGAAQQIRVNAVCPGPTQTPGFDRFLETTPSASTARAFIAASNPLGRLGKTRDVAACFVFLASDEAQWMTGVALPIDGGMTAGLPSIEARLAG